MIYLDNAATTALDPLVLEAMLPWLTSEYGNASSVHAAGRRARVAIENAREEIAASIGAHPAELIFTSGGTESNNTIIRGCVQESDLARYVYCGSTEHHAVLEPMQAIADKAIGSGILPVDERGELNWDHVGAVNRSQTLLSVMYVNNETGFLQDIVRVRELAPDVLLHTDAVQALGKVPLNLTTMGVDFASFSAHKVHGPKGIGAMFIRKGIDFPSIQRGGGQERNRRAGTEPVALIVGFQHAVRRAMTVGDSANHTMRALRNRLWEHINHQCSPVTLNTVLDQSAPHILNVSFPDISIEDAESIIQLLDIHGLAVSSGSACVSGSQQPSHVLKAMHRSMLESKSSVRFSLSNVTTSDEIDQASAILESVIREMRV